VAAGLCATCGALCCADCVELEMGWTTQRAVCHACWRERGEPPSRRRGRAAYWIVGAVIVLVLCAWLLKPP